MSVQTATVPTAPVARGARHRLPLATTVSAKVTRLARLTWLPVAAYVITTVTHLLVLHLLTKPGQQWGDSLTGKLTAWDGNWFLDVAQHGYPHGFTYDANGKVTASSLAFLPLYPATTRLTHLVTGLSYPVSALVVANLALLALAVLLHRLLTETHGKRVAGLATVLLVCAQPMGLIFLMGYSEGLFTALALATLLAARRERWVLAGVLCSLAGLTRATGVAVAAALVVAVALHLWRERRVTARPLVGAALGCVGLPSYLLWVGLRVGRLGAWFTIQRAGWDTRWDFGASTWRFLRETFDGGDGWVTLSTAVLLVVATLLVLGSVRVTWPPLAVYGFLILAMAVGQSNFWGDKCRMLLPVVVLVVPLARALSAARWTTVVTVLTCGTAFSAWYGAYMLTTWRYGI